MQHAALFENSQQVLVGSELELVRVALDLGAGGTGGSISAAEDRLTQEADGVRSLPGELLAGLASDIHAGGDPLGELLCSLRSGRDRRSRGAFYTPKAIVSPMVDWMLMQDPARIVDPGCGSGRFVAELCRRDHGFELWAIDVDPIQTLITRAVLAVLGATSAHVRQADYLGAELPAARARTGFISNPPYVRHHGLPQSVKAWGATAAGELGHRFSGLAGLHAHFFLATAQLGRPDDVGCFITSAEWLAIGYGSVIRELLLDGLGGESLHIVEPSSVAFDDAQTTCVITCFRFGAAPQYLRVRRVASVKELGDLGAGRPMPRTNFAASAKWSALTMESRRNETDRQRLGEFFDVHRGIVTGANDFFVLSRERAHALGISPWCVPVISDGKEILESNGVLRDHPGRKVLLRIPKELDRYAYPELDAYLRLGELPAGHPSAVANRYISSHRSPWWYLGGQGTPPVVATYMARQAPMFALNPDGLAVLNIAHGLFPRNPMKSAQLSDVVNQLNGSRECFRGRGRTYQGGLEKFEPREMEALPIPVIRDRADVNG